MVVDEITVISSGCGPFDRESELLASERVDLTHLIAAEYRLSEGIQAFDRAQQKGVLNME